MKTLKIIVISLILVTLTGLFIYGEISQNDSIVDNTRPYLLILLTLLYWVKAPKRSFYFSMFLVLCSLSELTVVWVTFIPALAYSLGNSLYILAYMFLIIQVYEQLMKQQKFQQLIHKYWIPIIILLVIDVLLAIVLFRFLGQYHSMPEVFISTVIYYLELIILLNLGVLNLLEKNYTSKAIVLFLAILCAIISEITLITYYYNVSVHEYKIVYSLLLVMLFYLFYRQSLMGAKEEIPL